MNCFRINIRHLRTVLHTTPISEKPLLDFEAFHSTASLASPMEAELTESYKGPARCGREAATENTDPMPMTQPRVSWDYISKPRPHHVG